MSIFAVSIGATAVGLSTAYWYGGWYAMLITIMLSVMEISLSFDNAIVNATVLKDMDHKWRQRFLTWGILIAVFGMRLVFPIVLVAFITHLNSFEVLLLAIRDPQQYSLYLTAAHDSIAAFGGMFLLMVFLGFMFNEDRKIHWLGAIERNIAKIGNLQVIEVVVALATLMGLLTIVPMDLQTTFLVSGIWAIVVYVVIDSSAKFMNSCYRGASKIIKRTGIMSFVYLEVLDASFSFDGVMGAFAITKDLIIIMIGLGIGAFFVRSLTILLVEKKTLEKYIYLEHGAHYAIGALAIMMFLGIVYTIPEVVIGGVGLVIILLSYYSSVRQQRR